MYIRYILKTMRLEDEIKTSFTDEYHKLIVNIIYSQNFISRKIMKMLKPYGISTQQFNVLRILRGQGGVPVNISLLIERMLDKMSNASRLVDKLHQKGFVAKKKLNTDRRNAQIIITDKGTELLEELDPIIDSFNRTATNLSKAEARQLNDLLDKMR